ncbi:uncharacterized protein TNCV_3123471 [Trichonephila clavipes]|nr:uncharacterized protein TNCV_3123471 [Trichonephila clavipes]
MGLREPASRVVVLQMISCLENSPCTTLVSFQSSKLVPCKFLLKRPICIYEKLLVPRKYNSFNNVPLVYFLIDFNALFHKNQRCFATFSNSATNHDRLWILGMFTYWKGAWSVHTPDSIVLGVIKLLNRKELLINEKESLPALTFGPSQKFSASSEPYEFVFFSEKLYFSQLVRLQFKLHFCYPPHRSVTYAHVTSDLSHRNPRLSLDSLFDGLTIP